MRSNAIRLTLAAILALGLPRVAAAQSDNVPRLPEIVPPLPPIGLPLPRIGLPPASETQRPTGRQRLPGEMRRVMPPPAPARDGRHPGDRRVRRRASDALIYVLPPLAWEYAVAAPAPQPEPQPAEQKPLTGTLRLDVQPGGSLPLYVDGYYVGTTDQFYGGLELEAGPHRIEIRASGFEPLGFDVRVSPDRVVTFKDSLKPLANAPPPAAVPAPPPAPPSTFYVIPGCYVGNVPPAEARLPEGCDPTLAKTFKQ
jgi:hypothetical protein